MKRTLSWRMATLTMALIMLLALLCGCGTGAASSSAQKSSAPATSAPQQPDVSSSAVEPTEEPGGNEVTYPLVAEPITLTCMCDGVPWNANWDVDEPVARKMISELTNVYWEYKYLSMGDGQETFNIALSSGDYPDVFHNFKRYYQGGGIDAAIDNDIIIDMTSYIENYMPNYYAILQSNPEYMKEAVTDEGTLWGIYMINETPQTAYAGPAVRKDWLDELELEVPVTLADWEEVLTAFTAEKAPKGALGLSNNGFIAGEGSFDIVSAFNCGTSVNPFIQIDGQVQFSFVTDGFKEYLTLMHDWYDKGLVYNEFVNLLAGDTKNQWVDNSIGVGNVQYVHIDEFPQSADEGFAMCAVPMPVKNEGDELHLNLLVPDVRVDYGTVVSTACEYPELACQYYDYMWTEDGIKLVNYGPQGVTWDYNEAGEVEFTDVILNDQTGNNPKGLFTYYGCFNTSTYNDWTREACLLSDEAMAALDIWDNAGTEYVLPALTMTVDEADEYATLMGDIKTYITSSTLQFITGEMSLDSDWDTYVSTLEAMDYMTCEKITQDALNRYNARTIE